MLALELVRPEVLEPERRLARGQAGPGLARKRHGCTSEDRTANPCRDSAVTTPGAVRSSLLHDRRRQTATPIQQAERLEMRIVVIGGTGLIGSKLVTKLTEHGHEAVPASLDTGVNTITGDRLEEA